MLPIDVNERIRYVLKRERAWEAEKQSVFILRPLKTSLHAQIQDQSATMTSEEVFSFKTASTTLDILREGLTGWENVPPGGDPVEFRLKAGTDKPAQATLDMIPLRDAVELANAITSIGQVKEEEEKN